MAGDGKADDPMRNEKGLTLIEILAAITILSLAVIMFVNISGYKMLSNSKSDSRAQAFHIAEQRLIAVQQNHSLPNSDTQGKFTVTHEFTNLIISPGAYNTDYSNQQHVSLQKILYHNSTLSLLTVTVAWEGL